MHKFHHRVRKAAPSSEWKCGSSKVIVFFAPAMPCPDLPEHPSTIRAHQHVVGCHQDALTSKLKSQREGRLARVVLASGQEVGNHRERQCPEFRSVPVLVKPCLLECLIQLGL